MNQAALELLIQLKDEASQGIGNIGNALSSIGGLAVAGAGIAGAAIGGFLVNAVKDAAEAQGNFSQLQQVIKSTGGAAGLSADQVADMAGALQKTTKFSDDAIIKGQSLLLTFTGIGKDVFPDVTKTMLDMSQAMGTDLSGTAMQLGKALNDPVKGMAALSRSGVTFTDAQKDMVKSMQESGNVAGAQKLILAELAKEFGGSAEAAGKTFSGQLEIAKNMLGEFSEAIGNKILPVITPLLGRLLELAQNALPAIEASITPVIDGIGNAATAFGTFVDYISAVVTDGDYLNDFLSNLPGPIQPIVQGIGEVVAALVTFVQYMGLVVDDGDYLNDFLSNLPAPLQPIAQAFGQAFVFVKTAISDVVTWVTTNGPLIGDVIGKAFTVAGTVGGTFISVITGTIMPALGTFVGSIVSAWPQISATAETVFATVSTAVSTVSGFIASTLIPAITNVVTFVVSNWPQISATFQTVFAAASTAVSTVAGFITGTLIPAITNVVTFVIANWPLIQTTISTVFGQVVGFISTNVAPIFTTLQGIFSTAVSFVTTNWPVISSTMATVFGVITGLLTGTVQPQFGFLQGIFQQIVTWVQTNWPLIQATAQSVFAAVGLIINTLVLPTFQQLQGMFTEIVTWVQTNWPLIQAVVGPVLNTIVNIAKVALPAFAGVFYVAFEGIKLAIQVALDVILSVLRAAMQLMTGDTSGAMETIQTMFSTIWNRIKTTVSTVINTIKGVIGDGMANVKQTMMDRLNETVAFVESLPGKFVEAGRNLIQGLWDGISSAGGWFKDKFNEWLRANLPQFARDALGIGSPSKVAADEIGVPFVQGIMAGIQAHTPMLQKAMMNLSDKMMFTPVMPQLAGNSGMTWGGNSGPVTVNLYATVSNDTDIEQMAYSVAKIVSRRLR